MRVMFRPNPPRMITVIVSVTLLALGLALALLPLATIKDVVHSLPLPAGLERDALRVARDETVAYLCLLASPLLLALGSLLPGL